jgi:hypothetical protein
MVFLNYYILGGRFVVKTLPQILSYNRRFGYPIFHCPGLLEKIPAPPLNIGSIFNIGRFTGQLSRKRILSGG